MMRHCCVAYDKNFFFAASMALSTVLSAQLVQQPTAWGVGSQKKHSRQQCMHLQPAAGRERILALLDLSCSYLDLMTGSPRNRVIS